MNLDSEVVVARKWGHSIGVTLPVDIVIREKIRPNDRVIIWVKRVPLMKKLVGTWKSKKSTQELKDELKKGWD
jgi:antitoxin component of MazEF toxin-antitoxin module